MKQMPKIQKFMTPMPETVGKDIPIATALSKMREHRIRHLPVQEAGRLVGILTDRDLKLATSFEGTDRLKVEDVMTSDPYKVPPEAPLKEVVSEMARHKYGCAIIQQKNGKVVGIFTSIDALEVLAKTLDEFYRPANGDVLRSSA